MATKAAGNEAAKRNPAKKAAAKRAAAPAKSAGTSAAKPAPGQTASPGRKPAGNKAAAKQSATKAHSHQQDDNYTDPALRERIKREVMAGSKGGKPGQWSARKAQMVAHEYEAQGGRYKHERTETQEHLKEWGDEHWHTADGAPAIRPGKDGVEETHRYLPDKA